jgi:hypothetical protein
MLTRFHKILLALLAAQIVLVILVVSRGDDSAALKAHPILAGFDAAKVTRLQVFAGKDARPLDLAKRDAGWVLASGFDYPVDQAKVTDALAPLAKLTAAAPTATQAARHKQLHVADADFERKLVITQDGKDTTLYIGGSAGLRRVAVRIGGSDDVFGVTGISAAAVGSEPRQWVDPGYVKLSRDDIAKLVVARDGKTVELARSAPPPPAGSGSGAGSAAGSGAGSAAGSGAGSAAPPGPPAAEHWSVTVGGAPITLAAGESIDEATIDRLVGQAGTIDLSSPGDPKRDASRPTATLTIERKASGTSTPAPAPTILDVVADGTSYWVHDRSLPRAVLVDKARLDDVLGVDRDKLVKKPPPPPPPAATPGAGSAVRPGPGPAARPGAGSAALPPSR